MLSGQVLLHGGGGQGGSTHFVIIRTRRNSGKAGKPWASLLAGSKGVTTAELPLKAVTRAHRETRRPPRQPQSPLRLPLATLLHEPLVWCSPLILGRSLPQCWLFSWAPETFDLAGPDGHCKISDMSHVPNASHFPKFLTHQRD